MQLPETFLEQMKQLLGSDYDAGNVGERAGAFFFSPGSLDRKWLLYWRGCKSFPPSLLLCGTILPAGAKCHGTGGSSAGLPGR